HPPPPLSTSRATPPLPPATSPLSLHDALPICDDHPRPRRPDRHGRQPAQRAARHARQQRRCHPDNPPPSRLAPPLLPSVPSSALDRKSTRLNSSHLGISYAVFCLKKKKKK